MTGMQIEVRRLEGVLKYDCAVAERLINLIPGMKGNGLLGAILFRLMPSACRRARLSLSDGWKEPDLSFDLTNPTHSQW